MWQILPLNTFKNNKLSNRIVQKAGAYCKLICYYSSAMSMSTLPKQVEPRRLAEQAGSLQGTLPVAGMERLVSLLQTDAGEVRCQLDFTRDVEGLVTITTDLSTSVQLQCQRCLSNVDVAIEANAVLSPVSTDDEAANLPERYEALMLEGDTVTLSDMIEDEIILQLPIIAMHEEQECSVKIANNEQSSEEKPNPFQVLADLKLSQTNVVETKKPGANNGCTTK